MTATKIILIFYPIFLSNKFLFIFFIHFELLQLIYFGFGTQQIVQRDCEGIEKKLNLYLDNKLIDLPELQSIVFLNIDSWGAGCKLCGNLLILILKNSI